MIFWFPQLTLNGRLAGIDWLHFWRKNENWLKNGRSRGWAVSGAGWSSQISWSGQPAPETAQPLDLPFLIQFSFFLQKCSPHMLGHLSLSVNHKLKKLNHSSDYCWGRIIYRMDGVLQLHQVLSKSDEKPKRFNNSPFFYFLIHLFLLIHF